MQKPCKERLQDSRGAFQSEISSKGGEGLLREKRRQTSWIGSEKKYGRFRKKGLSVQGGGPDGGGGKALIDKNRKRSEMRWIRECQRKGGD